MKKEISNRDIDFCIKRIDVGGSVTGTVMWLTCLVCGKRIDISEDDKMVKHILKEHKKKLKNKE